MIVVKARLTNCDQVAPELRLLVRVHCRVIAVKAETDGDLHIELQNATGDKPGIVVCEVPAKPKWCEIRKTVFSWTRTRFPLHIRSKRKLTINKTPLITVTGKAFWDIGHAPKD